MGNVVFYKDANETFECDIQIEGASSSQSITRLILEFSNRTLLFEGTIENGHVMIDVPQLSEITDKEGLATLEVIADQTFFKAWQSPFDLENKRSVTVTEVMIGGSSKRKVRVENVSKEKPSVNSIPSETGIYRNSCSKKNKKFVVESFQRFKSMDKKEKKQIKEALKAFSPKPSIEGWADTVFNNADTQYAKYCMYEIQQGMFKRSK